MQELASGFAQGIAYSSSSSSKKGLKKEKLIFHSLGLLFYKLHWLNKEWEGAVDCLTQLRAGRGVCKWDCARAAAEIHGIPSAVCRSSGGFIWRYLLHSPGLHCSSWEPDSE